MQAYEGASGKETVGANAPGLWRTLAGIALIVIGVALSWWLSGPPQARHGAVAGDEFSVDRAMGHVRAIAREPHPTGSPANARVRDYLVGQLRAIGLDVQVQRELSLGSSQFAWVENVVGVLPGTDGEASGNKAILLMSHYDSTPWAPGASDAGAGVATVLEAARNAAALDRNARKHDLIVLLSDGEELGLLGARAFFAHHPLASRVGAVLNFEGRGSRGPALMFQAGPGSTPLLRALTDASPVANSYAQEIYKRMPNDTDFSVALERGLPGLNFAFIDGYFDYHSPTDTPANLAPDTLQHMGDQAFAATRAALVMPAGAMRAGGEQSYMNVTAKTFFRYPPWVDIAVLALATALFGFAALRIRHTAPAAALQTARAALGALAAIGTAVAVVFAVSTALRQDYWPGAMLRAVSAQQTSWFVAWCVLAVGVAMAMLGAARKGLRWPWALALALLASLPMVRAGSVFFPGVIMALIAWALLRKPLGEAALVRGTELLLLVLGWALVLWLPGAANVLVWPLLAIAVARAVAVLCGATWPKWPGFALLVLATLFSAVVLGELALSVDLALGAGVPVIGVVPMLLLCTLCIEAWLARRAATVGVVLAMLGGVFAFVLILRAPFDVRHPLPSSVFVLHDRVQNADCLATVDATDDAWKREAMGATVQPLPQNNYAPEVWRQARCAPLGERIGALVPVPQVRLRVLGVEQRGDVRRLRLALHAQGGRDALDLYLPKGVDLRGVEVAGKSMQVPPSNGFEQWPRRIRGFALPDADVELGFDVGPGPLPDALLAVGIDYGLPAGLGLPARPVGLMPQTHAYSDARVAVARVPLETVAAVGAAP